MFPAFFNGVSLANLVSKRGVVEFLGDDEEANFTNALYVCYKNIESCCSCDIISKIIIFSLNIEVYPHSTETRSIKEDILLDVVIKPIKVGADEVVIPPGTKIKFLSNSYCSS
ncbi:hypothetical protein DDB_G0270872 [Dictyostelium discoideum AX4]|uniref:hypothetical protein n=1 Tax=Dictyostelium discoideum AX4 TaxID=352472 RepID=UPI00004E2B16|nr:hypothetical protein DDB_G0270872 [Dictyostelium discoideum AX4]EAL72786.1 hypothetical protein DDB_G0270872 [Dictyostelium discoideum AX4]|eukprot:XP_645998.1 hypothetical protein DDB_G0270872 [Dictyostelium discoideum AX4]